MAIKVVFDGANIAYPQGFQGNPDLDRYSSVVIGVCDRLGLDPATEAVTIFDAGFERAFSERQRSELRELRRAWGEDKVVACPAGERADAWILDFAHTMSAIVISGDRYKDHPNRHGAVLVPVLPVGGTVMIRDAILMGRSPNDDQKIDLDPIFPGFAERRLDANPGPRPSPEAHTTRGPRAPNPELLALVTEQLATMTEESWTMERLAQSADARRGQGWFLRAAGACALGTSEGVEVWGDPSRNVYVRLRGRGPIPPPPPPPVEAPPEDERFREDLRHIIREAKGGEILLAELANQILRIYPNGTFKAICERLAPGRAEGRFRRLVETTEGITITFNEANQPVARLRGQGEPGRG